MKFVLTTLLGRTSYFAFVSWMKKHCFCFFCLFTSISQTSATYLFEVYGSIQRYITQQQCKRYLETFFVFLNINSSTSNKSSFKPFTFLANYLRALTHFVNNLNYWHTNMNELWCNYLEVQRFHILQSPEDLLFELNRNLSWY